MTAAEYRDVIEELAREALGQLSPAELMLFDSTADAFFQDPEGVTRSERADDDILGSGLGLDVALIGPAVLYVASVAVNFVGQELLSAGKDEAKAGLKELVKAVFQRLKSRTAGTAPTPGVTGALSAAQERRLRDLVAETGQALKLSTDQISVLSNALAGGLAAPSGPAPSAQPA
ncbi:MAG: hypothetical protein U0821_19555 [Chloroflexota bacterium]